MPFTDYLQTLQPHSRNTATRRHSRGHRKWFAESFCFEKFSATFGQFLLTVMKKLSATFGHFSPAALHAGMKVFCL